MATDVDNPLTGSRGAAAVFGPQKGDSPDDVVVLEAALGHYGAVLRRGLGAAFADVPGAGDLVGLPGAITGAVLVVTGEGSLDEQTLSGKAPAEVAARARAAGVPCLALAGAFALSRERLTGSGFTAAHALTEIEAELSRCLAEPNGCWPTSPPASSPGCSPSGDALSS